MNYNSAEVKMKKLPDKKPGRHRWIAIATFIISEEGARSAHDPTTDSPHLDMENLWDIGIACIDSEEVYTPDIRRFCEGPTYEEPGAK